MSQAQPQGQIIRLSKSSSPAEKMSLGRMRKTGKATRLAKGLYVVETTMPIKEVVRHHFFVIAALYWPDGVFVGKSAL